MAGPAANHGGGARPATQPAASPEFQLVDLTLIHRGNLVARVKLQMSSGMILSCNVLRPKNDQGAVFVLPVGERIHGGGFAPIVEFASKDLREAWQASALAALRPRWAELMNAPSQEAHHGGF